MVVAPVGAVVPAGAAAGVAGVPAGDGLTAGGFGALIGATGAVPLTTDPEPPRPMIDSAIAPSMKSTDRIAVAFDSTVAPARAPNADWLPPPPINRRQLLVRKRGFEPERRARQREA